MINTVRNIFLVHKMFKLWKQNVKEIRKDFAKQLGIPYRTDYSKREYPGDKFILREQIDFEVYRTKKDELEEPDEELDEIEYARTINWCWDCKYPDCDKH